ncbi:leucine rich repeat proteins [Moesziomyces antarcticus T-34]|uniref:JmjC domain-containing histone demethylation protein 1 n=1 Tax=Pseudozyma antarctica (strain T-34) TaxID=1151754 RepID=M9M1P7_PSEA3|nr:leucine rich repeat proteins [Moesziomyces antarcticus T-34]
MTIAATAPPLNGEVAPRSLRTSPRKRAQSPIRADASASTSTPAQRKQKKPRAQPVDESELDCAACPAPGEPAPTPGKDAASDRETWICCTQCKTWFHCICIGLENPDDYSKWYCQPCITRSQQAFDSGTSTSRPPLANVARPPRRKSHRAKLEVDYAAIQDGIPADPLGRWRNFLDTYDFEPDRFPRMQGHEWTLDWLLHDEHALRQPVLVPASETPASTPVKRENDDAKGKKKGGARLVPRPTSIPGMVVPPAEMTIGDIADLIGHDTPVEVIDVASQSSSKASWTISEWAEYFTMPKHKKKKTLNVISLEVTGTPLQAYVEAPQLVRDLDWVTRDWPSERRDATCADNSWPKVQRYVLMGVEGAYSDWHIDFAGSSVYYHVIWGQKTFLFAPPTPRNLAAYKAWCSSTRQDFDWLGDHLHGLTRVDIRPGETMLIPSGWLHCVYTPQNTLVVGGNFLTDWNVATQWKLVGIEDATKVPKKFRFPHLKRLSWYVASGWNRRLSGINRDETDEDRERILSLAQVEALVDVLPPKKVLEGIELVCQSLADDLELMQDEFILESGDERAVKQQKAAREAVPTHHVGSLAKAEAMLGELKERLERAMRVADQVDAARQGLASKARQNGNRAASRRKARR